MEVGIVQWGMQLLTMKVVFVKEGVWFVEFVAGVADHGLGMDVHEVVVLSNGWNLAWISRIES